MLSVWLGIDGDLSVRLAGHPRFAGFADQTVKTKCEARMVTPLTALSCLE
jgi:hypothetical protein